MESYALLVAATLNAGTVLAIAAMGPSAQLDLSPNGHQASLLLEVARRLSQRLGAPPQAA